MKLPTLHNSQLHPANVKRIIFLSQVNSKDLVVPDNYHPEKVSQYGFNVPNRYQIN